MFFEKFLERALKRSGVLRRYLKMMNLEFEISK